MTLINLKETKKIEYLLGGSKTIVSPMQPYNDLIIEFIDELSSTLRNDKTTRIYPDIMAFAFWCRKSNIYRLKNDYDESSKTRLGLGLIFHISPSNVPLNFAFSFIFGLLSGNSNIVRLPSKMFPQVYILCSVISRLLQNKKYKLVKDSTAFISYERDDRITGLISEQADGRVIWGGDETVKNLKSLPTKSRCIDIAFADRFSFSAINSDEILALSDKDLNNLLEGFYNDTYLMDQNACSSPHLIIWIGSNKKNAQKRFWTKLNCLVEEKYEISETAAVDKYLQFCKNAIDLDQIKNFEQYGNNIYIIDLKNLFTDLDKFHGKFGYFFQYDACNLDEVSSIINIKYQTLTYFGIDKNEMKNFIIENSLQGIDRVVPIGKALDMDVFWDGIDVVKSLSRIIDLR